MLFVALALNLPDNFVARLGFESNYLLLAGAALLISWTVQNHNVFMTIVIVLLVVGANVPKEMAASIGYDRDILFAVLLAVMILPSIRHFLDLE